MTLGINCTELALLAPADMKRVLADIAAFGFKHVRFEVPWLLIEAVKGRRVWGPNTYNGAPVPGLIAIRDEAARLGLTLLPVLGVHCPAWAWGPADVKVFATEAAQNLRVSEYEIWNEPNLHAFVTNGAAATYVPWLNAAYDGIKSVSLDNQVVMGGLAAAVDYTGLYLTWLFGFIPWPAWFTNTSPETFLKTAIALNARFDRVAYHPYSINQAFVTEPPTLTQQMISKVAALRTITPKPLLLTEWGFDYTKTTPAQAASWFGMQLPLMVERSYFYSWRDYTTFKFGLVDGNNAPRQPIYDAVKAALAGVS